MGGAQSPKMYGNGIGQEGSHVMGQDSTLVHGVQEASVQAEVSLL
jgi:hypothetical protein